MIASTMHNTPMSVSTSSGLEAGVGEPSTPLLRDQCSKHLVGVGSQDGVARRHLRVADLDVGQCLSVVPDSP